MNILCNWFNQWILLINNNILWGISVEGATKHPNREDCCNKCVFRWLGFVIVLYIGRMNERARVEHHLIFSVWTECFWKRVNDAMHSGLLVLESSYSGIFFLTGVLLLVCRNFHHQRREMLGQAYVGCQSDCGYRESSRHHRAVCSSVRTARRSEVRPVHWLPGYRWKAYSRNLHQSASKHLQRATFVDPDWPTYRPPGGFSVHVWGVMWGIGSAICFLHISWLQVMAVLWTLSLVVCVVMMGCTLLTVKEYKGPRNFMHG